MSTVVVGGGLAGALAARALDQAGEEVTVVDAGEEPGGIAGAIQEDGYLLEPAVGSLMLPHPALNRLLDGLEVAIESTEPAVQRRYVQHRGRLLEVRPGPRVATSSLLSPAGKVRLLAEPFVRPGPDHESLQAFLSRRLGREAGEMAAWLMASGVYAGDPSSLSVEAAFPALSALERQHGSLLRGLVANRREAAPSRSSLHVVTGGTASIARQVARSLGGRWLSSWRVTRMEQRPHGWRLHGPETIDCRRVIAAVGSDVLAELHPSLVSDLAPAPWAPVAVVWLGLARPALPEGFGVLVGPEERFATLGFLYESAYAPDRAPAGRGLVKAIVGGATNPAPVTLPDRELIQRVEDELTQVLGSTLEVEMSHAVRHHPGIPQYTASRHKMVQQLREALPPGLEVCGWAYDGVGVAQLAQAACRLASR